MRWLLFLGFTPISCFACSCAGSLVPLSACQTVWQYQAVFTGVAVDIVDPGFPTMKPGDPPPSFESYPRKKVTVKINEAFIGVEPGTKEIMIETGLGGGDCGYAFERGVEYIIYAHQGPRGLSTGICSPTRPVVKASEDLAYLRKLPEMPTAGEIRVTAIDLQKSWEMRASRKEDFVRLSGAKVSLEGQDIRRTAETDSNGRVVFGDFPPGEYQVRVAIDGYMLNLPSPPVKLHAKGCADVTLPLQLDRVVTGVVRTKEGQPASGISIEAIPARPQHENDMPYATDRATTDAQGRYELRNLRTGDYYLGTSLERTPTKANPYTRWFYPGTEDPQVAALIQIPDRPEQQAFDLTLPDPQKPRVIEGIVLWPDGRNAEGIHIMLEDPRWPWQTPTVSVTTGSSGRFTTEGLDGTKYRIHAVTFINGSRSAEPVIVEPGVKPAKVQLILSRKGHTPSEQTRKDLDDWRQGHGLK